MSKKKDNVVYLNTPTRLDIPPKRVIKAARKAKLADVVVVGYTEEGEFYFASSVADGAEVLWMMKLAEKKLLEIGDE